MANIILLIVISSIFFVISIVALCKLFKLCKKVEGYELTLEFVKDRLRRVDNRIDSIDDAISKIKPKDNEPKYPWIIVHAEDGNTYTCYFSNGRWNLNKKEETEIPDDVYKDITDKIQELDKEKERINAEKVREIIAEYEMQKAQQIRNLLIDSIKSNINSINQCCSMDTYNSLYANRYWYY